ncbi:MAG: hypothetical protein ACR2K6_08790 [Solirubrobacterales bacterium]
MLAKEDEFFHGRSLVCPGRELRITGRCLTVDLGRHAEASLEDIQGHDIVRALPRERRDKDIGRLLTGLVTSLPVGVLAHGHDHRGATWFDEDHGVVWLLAYRLHRSGQPDDFFPWAQQLDADEELFPTAADYERLELERAERFVKSVLIESQLLLKEARANREVEVSRALGGAYAVGVAVEVADDLESITVAFDLTTLRVPEHKAAILAVLAPTPDWVEVDKMPIRGLRHTEQAYQYTSSS